MLGEQIFARNGNFAFTRKGDTPLTWLLRKTIPPSAFALLYLASPKCTQAPAYVATQSCLFVGKYGLRARLQSRSRFNDRERIEERQQDRLQDMLHPVKLATAES